MNNSLKHQFYYALPNNGSQEGINSTTRRMEEAEKCEQIADEFAIEFANWFVLRYTEAVFYREDYTEDLLEEFKKEKGL